MTKKKKFCQRKEKLTGTISKNFSKTYIIEDKKWFHFQGIMLYAEDNIERPKYHFKLLLKVFSIFKIRIIYDETIDKEYFPDC